MNTLSGELNFDAAVNYHYNQFPPTNIDYSKIVQPLGTATAALARYDQMLRNMRNSEILLAPLRRQEAVISSRMEGTISTLDEVLRYEADQDGNGGTEHYRYRSEAMEVFLYHRAMQRAQGAIEDGAPISDWLVRAAHKMLLGFGRGADKSPGEYKNEQNYLVDRSRRNVLFIPISPEQLQPGMDQLFAFIENDAWEILIRTALAHIEFEALHPFKDGNGRIGRMLITLMLWKHGPISAPHFHVSGYLEERKDEYVDKMREASSVGEWTAWCVFFLNALEAQANNNLRITEEIRALYDQMKDVFRDTLSSQWSVNALDFIFETPVFRNNRFTTKSGIPGPTASRFARLLVDAGLLTTLEAPAGRRPALYAFEPLLELVRD